MPSLNYPQTTKWVVAHDNNTIFHYSAVEPQNCFATGQPFMEVFDSKEEMLSAFPQLSTYFVNPLLSLSAYSAE